MQATDIRRFVRSWTASLTVAIVIVVLAVAAVGALALTSALDGGQSSVSRPATAPFINKFEHMRLLEENSWQNPYTTARTLSSEEIAFIESNTFQIPYVAPSISYEDIRFIEENTLGFHASSAHDQMHGPAHVVYGACSSESIARPQANCADY